MATITQKARLLKGLIDGERAFTGPIYLDLDLTRRCNMGCFGCQYNTSRVRVPSPGDRTVMDISFDLIEKLTEELPALGTREVFLVGEGEPLLYPRLFEAVSALKRAGLKVQLFTNGTLIDEEKAASILESDVDILRVSLWAVTREEYQKLYPGIDPERMTRILEGIRIITRLKAGDRRQAPRVILSTPLNAFNQGSIGRRIDLAHETGCHGISFDTYRHWQGEFAEATLGPEETTLLCQNLEAMRKHLDYLSLSHNIDDILLKYRLGEKAWQDLPCYVGWFYTRIRADGTVVPCGASTLPLGNLHHQSFREIWDGPGFRELRRKTLTRSGMHSLGSSFDCDWCGSIHDSYRIHRFFRWIAPLIAAEFDRHNTHRRG